MLNLSPSYPQSNYPVGLKVSKICDLIFNKSFMDPAVKGYINNELKEELEKTV